MKTLAKQTTNSCFQFVLVKLMSLRKEGGRVDVTGWRAEEEQTGMIRIKQLADLIALVLFTNVTRDIL